MRPPVIGDYIRLTSDLTESGLREGEVGVVRGRRHRPLAEDVYEVEFHQVGRDVQIETILSRQMRVEEGSLRGR